MMAPPNAMSHGSNGAGGGALTAFTGISAAKAEPAIVSIAATSTIFFITIPITFPRKSARNRRPPGQAVPDFGQTISSETNVMGLRQSVKRKSQAFADFLGVWTNPGKVVQTLLHSDNNFDLSWSGLRTDFRRPTT